MSEGARQFNHDLLRRREDREEASTRWPRLAHALVDERLIELFDAPEAGALAKKRLVHGIGTLAVLLMLCALVGGVVAAWDAAHAGSAALLFEHSDVAAEICGLLGLVLAFLASRFGPFRRRWLRDRFLAECLRQWHFREFLNAPDVGMGEEERRWQYLEDRDRRLTSFWRELQNDARTKMDLLVEDGVDPLGPLVLKTPSTALLPELLGAYGVLRLDHQLQYAVHKLSNDDRTTLRWLSIKLAVQAAAALAAFSLIASVMLSASQLFGVVEAAGYFALGLTVLGVAIRAWRDGMGLNADYEHFQEMRQRLRLLKERWLASDDDARFAMARELEHFALEELRAYLRTHGRAQFLA